MGIDAIDRALGADSELQAAIELDRARSAALAKLDRQVAEGKRAADGRRVCTPEERAIIERLAAATEEYSVSTGDDDVPLPEGAANALAWLARVGGQHRRQPRAASLAKNSTW
jgi:hypothetical protein